MVERRAAQSIPAMGHVLTAPLALIALLILAAAAPPRAAGKMPFSVTTRGLIFTDDVASVTVLPGADLDLEIAGDDGPYRVEASTGALSTRKPVIWRWRAPAVPGLVTLRVENVRGRKVMDLHVFVMVPFAAVRDGRLNG